MTAKRFTIDFDNHRIIDNKKNEYLVFLAQFKEVLNQLNEEKEQLKTKNFAYLQDIEVYKEENTHLKLKNEQLNNELFETKRDYIIETYSDNPIRRDEKLKALEKELYK